MVALYALCMCILKPGSIVIIAAGSKKQAGLIISEKIQGFFKENSPNFDREIKKITANSNDWEVVFHNGSKIKVVPATDLARGNRSTINIYEEFRIIDKNILDTVLSPFLISRQPPFLLMDKYKHLAEEPKEMYISSAYYKSEWWYKELATIVNLTYKGDNTNFIAFDYLLAVFHGLKTEKQIKREKEKTDAISFMMEYENIPFGENSNAYFKLDMFKTNKTLKRAFYPLRKDNHGRKRNPHAIKRVDGEVRLVSVDIATRAGDNNDNTIMTCMRLIPTAKGYMREIVYMESHNGENTITQTTRIKQIYSDFESDYIVLDIQQAGSAIYDQLGTVTKDEERGVEYDAFTIMRHSTITDSVYDELSERTLVKNATPVVYPISATLPKNSDIAVDFRDNLQRGMISFLVEAEEAEDYLITQGGEFVKTDDMSLKAWYLHPYMQITEMINETVNLEYTISNGYIKLQEGKNGRKDRYTSVSYGSWFASHLEKDLLSIDDYDEDDPLVFF